MLVTDWGIVIDLSLVHPENASCPILRTVFDISILVREEQFENALSFMLEPPFITILKELLPQVLAIFDATYVGAVILDRYLHFSKAFELMLEIFDGISILVKPVQL